LLLLLRLLLLRLVARGASPSSSDASELSSEPLSKSASRPRREVYGEGGVPPARVDTKSELELFASPAAVPTSAGWKLPPRPEPPPLLLPWLALRRACPSAGATSTQVPERLSPPPTTNDPPQHLSKLSGRTLAVT
jgi:hypothetical protein